MQGILAGIDIPGFLIIHIPFVLWMLLAIALSKNMRVLSWVSFAIGTAAVICVHIVDKFVIGLPSDRAGSIKVFAFEAAVIIIALVVMLIIRGKNRDTEDKTVYINGQEEPDDIDPLLEWTAGERPKVSEELLGEIRVFDTLPDGLAERIFRKMQYEDAELFYEGEKKVAQVVIRTNELLGKGKQADVTEEDAFNYCRAYSIIKRSNLLDEQLVFRLAEDKTLNLDRESAGKLVACFKDIGEIKIF